VQRFEALKRAQLRSLGEKKGRNIAAGYEGGSATKDWILLSSAGTRGGAPPLRYKNGRRKWKAHKPG